MENNDPILQLVEKVGVLTGLIKGLDGKMDDMKRDQARFIGTDTCQNIVNTAINKHIENAHKKNSNPPPYPLLTSRQKKILIGAVSTVATAVAGYLTARYGV